MTVKKLEFVEEVDNTPDRIRTRGELDQGETFDNQIIWQLTNEDGSKQFIAIDVTHDSYGDARSIGSGNLRLVYPQEKLVRVWT